MREGGACRAEAQEVVERDVGRVILVARDETQRGVFRWVGAIRAEHIIVSVVEAADREDVREDRFENHYGTSTKR